MLSLKNSSIVITILFISLCSLNAQISYNEHEELGKVHWNRDYNTATTLAKEQGKDVLVLFQEVPGCSTCRNYGHNVLSHPLMVEAIESLFIPLTVFNNKGGADKKILQKYGEPSWNNPVVRIINDKGINIIDRIGNDYSALTLCKRIKEALTKKGTIIPEYLNILEAELEVGHSSHIKEKCFKMYCFWTGEKQLGKVDGVLSTQSGFANHSEVVKVIYDETKISENELDNYARINSSEPVSTQNYKLSTNDLHYYLQHTDYKYLPLTEIQKTKINSALGYRKPTEIYLSPKQLKWLNRIKNGSRSKKSLLNSNFKEAWATLDN